MVGANFNPFTLSRGARKTVTASLVKLSGTNHRGATFTGSGVVVEANARNGDLKIKTARHNVSVFNDVTPALFDTMRFTTNVRLQTHDGKALAISGITLHGPGATGYDLAELDANDLAFAKAFRALTPLSEFTGLENGGELYQLKLLNLQKYETAVASSVLLQAGFGAASQNGTPRSDSAAQFRQVTFKRATFLARTHEGFEKVFVLPASAQSTSAPGDSGGPLYLINGDNVAVLGVNLGANYYSNKTDNSSTSDSENNAITSITVQTA